MKVEEYLFAKKNKNKKRIISSAIITHKNCPDGSASAVIAKNIFPTIALFPCNHQQIDHQILKILNGLDTGEKLLISDICCKEEVLTKMLPLIKEKKIFLGIYDHHDSTNWLKNFKLPEGVEGEIIFDSSRCGCKIFYDTYLKKFPEIKVYEDFINVNNDRDLWLQQDKRSVSLAKFHQILGDQQYISRFLTNPRMAFDEKETLILEYEKEQETKKHHTLLNNMQVKIDENDFRYGLIYGEADSSDLLNLAIEKFDLEYAILINLNSRKGSIRSRGNMDCVEYASKFGGGGHRRASGFKIDFKYPEF